MKKYYLLSFLLGLLIVGLIVAPVLAVNLVLAAAVLWLVADAARGFRRSRLTHAVNTLPANWGTNSNGKNYLSSAAIATRFLIGKFGADFRHIAVVSATSDEPIGIISDEAAAAEEEMFVELLGLTNRTVPVVAGEAIGLGVDLYATAAGKVGIKPTAAGTYWKVGKALQPAEALNDVIEMQPQKPRKLIVIAALTSTNGTAAGASASLANLAAEAEKIGDDVRLVATSLDLDADVALATT